MAQPTYNETDFVAIVNHELDLTISTFAAGVFMAHLDGGPYTGTGIDAEAVRDDMITNINASADHPGWTAASVGTNVIRMTSVGPGQHIGGGPGYINPEVEPPPATAGVITLTDNVAFEGIDTAELRAAIEADVAILTPLKPDRENFMWVDLSAIPRVLEITFEVDPLPAPEKAALDALVAAFTHVDAANLFTQFIRTTAQATAQHGAIVGANLVIASKGAPDGGLKLVDISGILGVSKAVITGLVPQTNQPSDTSEVVISPGCCIDDTNVALMALTSNEIIDLNVSGAGGLDTGVKANSTWYYVYLISKLDGTTTGLFSLSGTAPTMPAGYVYKRYLGDVLTDAGGAITDYIIYGEGSVLYYIWRQDRTYSPFRVKSAGSATSFSDISLAGAVPARTQWVKLVINNINSPTAYLRERDDNGGIDQPYGTVRVGGSQTDNPEMGVDTNLKIQYCLNSGGGSVYIDVVGYKVQR